MRTERTQERALGRARARRLTISLIVACGLLSAIAAGPAQAASGGAALIPAPEATGSGLAFSPWHYAGATWYGPGLYGRHTACGQTLRRTTLGVAHRSLPCGTAVKFTFHGHSIVTRVIDRGPYSKGNSWDLTSAAAEDLGFTSTGQANIRYAVAAPEYARP